MPGIRYETWSSDLGTPSQRFCKAVLDLAAESGSTRLCDIGAGANPLLPYADAERAGISDYVLTDISAEELEKAPDGYRKVVADITTGPHPGLGGFEVIVSHTVAEHVSSAERFHRSIYEMLAPGGRAMHFFPTFYEPVFLVNRVIPEAVGDAILARVQGDRDHGGEHQKFPALYRWCRGPTRRQLRRLERCGFEVEAYVGIFGHGYFHTLAPLDRLAGRAAATLQRHPVAALTSYAWVQLRRPAA